MISGNTLTIHLQNLALEDEFAFPGTVRVPSSLSLDITYTKSGNPRKIKPNHDPISAFNCSGKMWMATNSGIFSVSHSDGAFRRRGASAPQVRSVKWGLKEMGFLLTKMTETKVQMKLYSLWPLYNPRSLYPWSRALG